MSMPLHECSPLTSLGNRCLQTRGYILFDHVLTGSASPARCRFEKSGNEQFAIEATKWTLHERGHLKVGVHLPVLSAKLLFSLAL
jgi:hypothetical protein